MAPTTTMTRPRKPADRRPLTTHALCQASGATRGMLRLYEDEGLIPAPQRSAAGYRHYPPDTVQRLLAIRLLKEIGFSLREIALLLAEHAQGDIDPARLAALAAEQVERIDARIARLHMVRGYLQAVAGGEVGLIDDPECRFLADFLSAAPAPAHARTRRDSRAAESLSW